MPRIAPYVLVAVCLAFTTTGALAVLADPAVVSVSTGGAPGPSDAHGAAISSDGRHVAFTSTAPLAGPATGGVLQLYVRDRLSGRTLLASGTATGQPANVAVDDPPGERAYAISGDGRYVVFASEATNLAADESDGTARDVFRKDLATGAVTVVSRAPNGDPANGAVGGDPDVSYDGTRVVYETGAATNLWIGDTATASDIVVRDLRTRRVELVSVTPTGTPLTGVLRRASISADGSAVAFEDDTAVAVRNLAKRTTTAIQGAARPDLSGDGSVVVYESGGDVSRRALPAGAETQVLSPASAPQLSADGTRVVVESPSAHPPTVDQNGVTDVYAWRLGGSVERVSQRASEDEVGAPSTRPAVSGNGGIVAFEHDDGAGGASLAGGDINAAADVLVGALRPTDTTGPTLSVGDATQDGAAARVSGAVSDPSGVVGLTVGGYVVSRAAGNVFSVEVPIPAGAAEVVIRAIDGAGNVTERVVSTVRSGGPDAGPGPKARARSLSVRRAGRATLARFRLDPGATRVTVRLWRRIARAGRSPLWTPAGRLRRVAVSSGRRTVLVHNRRLRPDVYQVRVTVVSRGGVAVASARHQVTRSTRTR